MAILEDSVSDVLDLLDWKRRVFALYAEIRAAGEPERAWERWREVRGELFRDASAVAAAWLRRRSRTSPTTPRCASSPRSSPAEPERRAIGSSGDEPVWFTRFATARFGEHELELYWLDAYGGGLFLPFRDATAGGETYGAGRYLLDTVKGADLGMEDGRLVLDFNFAYHPSCTYDPRWACPLSPPANRIDVPIRAGERLAG